MSRMNKTGNFQSVHVDSRYEKGVLLKFTLDTGEYYGTAIHETETTREILAEQLIELAEVIRRGGYGSNV